MTPTIVTTTSSTCVIPTAYLTNNVTTSTFAESMIDKLPKLAAVVQRFLDYDDSELDTSEGIGKNGNPYLAIKDDDVFMHISQNEEAETFYLSLFKTGEREPYIIHAAGMDAILTSDDSFIVSICQLIARFERFSSVFA